VSFLAFISSLIGAAVATLVNYVLPRRHGLIMKWELCREILYRKQVIAYGKVYALVSNHIQNFQHPEKLAPSDCTLMKTRAFGIKKAIEDSSFLIPEKVMLALRGFDEVVEDTMAHLVAVQSVFKLLAEPPEDFVYIRACASQYAVKMKEFRDDLGVEALTADLDDFSGTPAIKKRWKAWWVKILKQKDANAKCRQKDDDVGRKFKDRNLLVHNGPLIYFFVGYR